MESSKTWIVKLEHVFPQALLILISAMQKTEWLIKFMQVHTIWFIRLGFDLNFIFLAIMCVEWRLVGTVITVLNGC